MPGMVQNVVHRMYGVMPKATAYSLATLMHEVACLANQHSASRCDPAWHMTQPLISPAGSAHSVQWPTQTQL